VYWAITQWSKEETFEKKIKLNKNSEVQNKTFPPNKSVHIICEDIFWILVSPQPIQY